ncbi:adenylate/guanylate cyclase domain-containing protein [Aerosakkonemataceae cyanobacterium BLCC-F154]|uniref:Adenylate/guanylate cyclase domain-containing protein n=1 Tax=Floridaenema fluviatile BLCC-F154 TaxID=3153640 RepID=A0ABV4Y982_9CYAN
MTELKLCVYLDNQEVIVPVDQDEFTIGRLPENDLHLPYFGISRCHARIVKQGKGKWSIEDMGSKNGTYLNEKILTTAEILAHNDWIKLGNIDARAIFNDSTLPRLREPEKPELDEGMTIVRNVNDLKEQWIQADNLVDKVRRQETSIARLKDLVDIAQNLNSAESIEEIFMAVKNVVFRYIENVERLALLIIDSDTGNLKLFNGAIREFEHSQPLPNDENWISRSICQTVYSQKIAIQSANAQLDERFGNEISIITKDIHSVMAVPLWDENKVVGVLYADGHIPISESIQQKDQDLSFFSTLANLVASSVQRWLLTRQLRSEERIRHRLERYHSPAVVQQMMQTGNVSDTRLIPKESEISIMFADIVGFTALSEKLTPAKIAELLNAFFEEMLQEVFAEGGTLDKFIGDCIMAFFGAPEPQQDHAERAFRAAKGMLTRLEKMNLRKVLSHPLDLRIAINSGKAVVGDVGSTLRVDYTVLGPTINLASRMESICPPGKLIVSDATYKMLQPSQRLELEEMGEYRFKGIDQPIPIYVITKDLMISRKSHKL